MTVCSDRIVITKIETQDRRQDLGFMSFLYGPLNEVKRVSMRRGEALRQWWEQGTVTPAGDVAAVLLGRARILTPANLLPILLLRSEG